MRFALSLLAGAVTLVPHLTCAELSAVEIVRKATNYENENLALRRQYTYKETANEKRLNKNGEARNTEHKVSEVFYIGGEQFRKLVAKDNRTLQGEEAAKEQRRLDNQIEKYKKANPAESAKREAKDLREAQEFRAQIVEAFDFRLVGEEKVADRLCYRIHADPKPGFQPRGEGKVLAKIRGDLWIDKVSFKWAKVEAETIDTVTGMCGLIRIAKGSTIHVRQTLVNNEVWFPDRMIVKANAKALFLLSAALEYDVTFSDFRKFSVDSTVSLANQ